MAERTLDEAEAMIARLHRQLFTAKSDAAHWYEANRLLENRVRKAASFTTLEQRSAALTIIARKVPIEPRAKYRPY